MRRACHQKLQGQKLSWLLKTFICVNILSDCLDSHYVTKYNGYNLQIEI
jgi:hypothetical protein